VFATGAVAASQHQSKASAAANTLILAAAAAAAGFAANAPAAAAAAHGDFAPGGHDLDAQLLSGGLELSPIAASAVAKLQVAEQLALSSDHSALAVSDSFRSSADAAPFRAQLDTGLQHAQPADLLHDGGAPLHSAIVNATPLAAPSVAMPSAEQLLALAGAAANPGAQHNQLVDQVLADALHFASQGGPDIDALLTGLPEHTGGLDLPLAAAAAHGDALTFAAGLMHDAALDHAGIAIALIHPDVMPPA